MNDKEIERLRYDNFSKKKINNGNKYFNNIGSKSLPQYIAKPYIFYEELIKNSLREFKNPNLLDLCCGDGVYSFIGAINGANVIALDYSEKSIEVAKQRTKSLQIDIDFRVCDVEKLPFRDNSFDIVTCVGSFSYIDHDVFIAEIYRVLKSGGELICLDSYNHNIIYKLNRYLHFLRGHRTYSTLKRMPNKLLMSKIKSRFKTFSIYHFGIFIFLAPVINIMFGENKTSVFLDKLDSLSLLNKYAFKIVFKAIK